MTATLPAKVTATLADEGSDWTVYRLEDARSYTHVRETIRVGTYNRAGDYRIEAWGRDGWRHVAEGRVDAAGYVPRGEAIARAVAILFGMEDHG